MKFVLYALALGLLGFGVAAVLNRAEEEPAAVLYEPLRPSIPDIEVSSLPNNADIGPITIRGEAIMDTSTGIPAVPYIKYRDANENVATKQLIFANTRGCLPGAGDIPCAPTYSADAGYPKLVTGQIIRVDGYIRANRFLVTSISVES